jgi:PST family polysaccharide transporter
LAPSPDTPPGSIASSGSDPFPHGTVEFASIPVENPADVDVDQASTQPSRRAIDRSLVHGVAWTAGIRWAIQLLSWGSTLFVARLLHPSDYGLVGMANVYLGFMQLITDFGLGGAIVQRRSLHSDQIARLGGFSILTSLGFFTISAALAFPIAHFFNQPPVRWIIIALSLNFITSGFMTVPRALLYRELRFKRLAAIEGLEAITLMTSTLVLAALGFRYWALVWGAVVGRVISMLAANLSQPHRIAWPRPFRTIASEVTMGSQLVGSQVSWYLYENADFAVVGRTLGDKALGAYTIAWTIATIPVEKVAAMLQRVTFSIFAKVQQDKAALRRYLAKLTEGLAFVTMPAAVGMALVADRFVEVALGAKWQEAVLPLRILCLYAGFRATASLFAQVLVATGQAGRSLRFNLQAALVLPVLFLIGSRWGTGGVAMGWIVGYPLVIVPFFMRTTLRHVEMSGREYFRALWPGLSGTAVMAAAVLAVRATLSSTLPALAALVLEAGVGALVFIGFNLAINQSRLAAFREFVRILRR